MSSKFEKDQTLIIDNGSSRIKYGYAGDSLPRHSSLSIVGRPIYPRFMFTGNDKSHYNCDDAFYNSAVLMIKYPIEHGIVTNWDDMIKVWDNTFREELRVDPSGHPILITEHANNPKYNREKMIQIMFETFKVPSFYVATKSVLPSYAYVRSNGIVCHIGDGVTHITPIIRNSPLPRKDIRQNFGGRELTYWLKELLVERGAVFTTTSEMEIVRNIKEKCSYVALDYQKELQKSNSTNDCDTTYTLPDGNVVRISDERFRCTELLFKPNMNGFQLDGIDKIIYDSIMKCDEDVQNEMFQNILLSGGCTMFKGFSERLEKEIRNLAPPKTKIRIVAMEDRNYAAWKGGSVLASLATFPQMVITRDEYNDNGPSIVHRKCS